MGTKNNPGKFDCYANAAPDEPMFILLGRDRHAPTLVRIWALLRHDDGEAAEKVAEALACATLMDHWKRGSGGDPSVMWQKLEPLLLAATDKMDEHPAGYNHACLCAECKDYE